MSTFVEGSAPVPAANTTAPSAPRQDSTEQPAAVPSAKTSANGDLAPDGYPHDLEIPIRYIKGMEGNMEEARRRWIETLKWRKDEKVDDILSEPSPSFDIIKEYYPHFYYKQAKNGSMVYYEIPGKINLAKLRENGLNLDMLCRHYIYITEFLWKELDEDPEGKLLTCMDMKGASLSMLAGDVKEFLVRSAKMIGAHYPERSYKIFILNAPWWFSIVWKVVSPFVHRNTRAKIVVCRSDFLPSLGELVDLSNVPQAVGGEDPTPPLQSPQEMKMRELVVDVLKKNNLEMRPVL